MATSQQSTPETPVVSKRRVMSGVVVRRSGDKTVAVQVERVEAHPLYHKRRTRRRTYLAHDEANAVAVGDAVMIRESRPLSARKRWTVVDQGDSDTTSGASRIDKK